MVHLIEHLILSDRDGIIGEIESLGGDLNGSTTKESVSFELFCHKGKFRKIVPLFLELVLNPKFSEKTLKIEKKVIVQEIKEDQDDIDVFVIEKAQELIFPKDYGHNIAGTIKHVKGYQIEDVVQFYQKHFLPSKLYATFLGATTSGFSRVRQCLSSLPFTGVTRTKPTRRNLLSKRTVLSHTKKRIRKDNANLSLLYCFDAVTFKHPDFSSFLILDSLLFSGLKSVFYRKLREEHGLVYGLYSLLDNYAYGSSYMMLFSVEKRNVAKLEQLVFNAMSELWEQVDEEMIENAKERVFENHLLAMDDMAERHDYFIELELYGEENFSLNEHLSKIQKVSKASVSKVLKRLITNRYSKIMVGPV